MCRRKQRCSLCGCAVCSAHAVGKSDVGSKRPWFNFSQAATCINCAKARRVSTGTTTIAPPGASTSNKSVPSPDNASTGVSGHSVGTNEASPTETMVVDGGASTANVDPVAPSLLCALLDISNKFRGSVDMLDRSHGHWIDWIIRSVAVRNEQCADYVKERGHDEQTEKKKQEMEEKKRKAR
jgi:hypothetical protein